MKKSTHINQKIFTGFTASNPLLRQWREQNKKIVFTNGCFDLVHRGHAEYLCAAAEMGDELVVGLNSDHSVPRLKGPGRPVMDEYSRAWLLASFGFVSAVIIFEEDTPLRLIESVSPDVLVKGNDYEAPAIVGYNWVLTHGGMVETIPLVPGWSTSAIIHKIRNIPQ